MANAFIGWFYFSSGFSRNPLFYQLVIIFVKLRPYIYFLFTPYTKPSDASAPIPRIEKNTT